MRSRQLLCGAAVLALGGVTVACGDSETTSAATAPLADTSAGPFCEAMGQLIVLLEPDDGRTSPAQTKATFTAAAGWFDQAERNAPDSLAADVATYSAAYDKYVHFLSEAGYNLDVVFSTPKGTQLAIDTSHTLTPSIVQYVTGECGLTFGDGSGREPPISSEVSSAVSAVEKTEVPSDTEISAVAATPSDDREAIIEFLRSLAAAGDDAFDEECVVGLIAQLSDEDAALVADIARAGGQGDPQLSPEGEAIGNQLATCALDTTTTTG